MMLNFYKMEIGLKSIVLYLNKKGMKVGEITIDINEAFHKDIIKYSTVTKYLRCAKFQHNNAHSLKKDVNPPRFYLTDIVVKTLKDYPFFPISQISEHTWAPLTTVYRILHLDLQYEIKYLRWIPHLLSSPQKVQRVEFCKSLLLTLQRAKRFQYKYFYT